jgi:uncharacterized protein YjbI with pentapeptide repeats
MVGSAVEGLLGPRRRWWRRDTHEYAFHQRCAELEKLQDPAARLQAIHDLEQLADAESAYRRTASEVLCGYLRAEPDASTGRTAARIVTSHTYPAESGRYWGPLDLDLDAVTLDRLDLRASTVASARFRGARFTGPVDLTDARVLGLADFAASGHIHPARFGGAHFDAHVDFAGVEFSAGAEFRGATFQHGASFAGAYFGGPADFTGAVFLSEATFSDARDGPAVFDASVRFDQARFTRSDLAELAGLDLGTAKFIHPPDGM